MLKPGGRVYINFTKGNKFGKLPSASELEKLGLRIIQERGPLGPKFSGQVFRNSNGTRQFLHADVLTTVLEKVQ